METSSTFSPLGISTCGRFGKNVSNCWRSEKKRKEKICGVLERKLSIQLLLIDLRSKLFPMESPHQIEWLNLLCHVFSCWSYLVLWHIDKFLQIEQWQWCLSSFKSQDSPGAIGSFGGCLMTIFLPSKCVTTNWNPHNDSTKLILCFMIKLSPLRSKVAWGSCCKTIITSPGSIFGAWSLSPGKRCRFSCLLPKTFNLIFVDNCNRNDSYPAR